MLQDQTPTDWQSLASPEVLGTGVFYYSSGTKDFAGGITYEQSQRRGTNALAFKWIPNIIAPEIAVRNAQGGGRCNDQTMCPPGCVCVNGVCR